MYHLGQFRYVDKWMNKHVHRTQYSWCILIVYWELWSGLPRNDIPHLHDCWLSQFYHTKNPKVRRSTNNCKCAHIIMPGVHCVDVRVASGNVYTNQQSGTSLTRQLENTTRALLHLPPIAPIAIGCSSLSRSSRPTGRICWWHRPTYCRFAKALACCQTFFSLF